MAGLSDHDAKAHAVRFIGHVATDSSVARDMANVKSSDDGTKLLNKTLGENFSADDVKKIGQQVKALAAQLATELEARAPTKAEALKNCLTWF